VRALLDWFAQHAYLTVFVTVTLELVGIPFPAETVLLAAGAAASTGNLTLPWVMLVAACAAVLGACGGYAIGRIGGRPLVERLSARGWPRQQQLVRVEQFMERHGGKSLVGARFVPFVRIFAPWLAGATHMPLRRFAAWNIAGGVLWVVVITTAGFVFARSLAVVEQALGWGAAVAVAVVLVALFVAHRVRSAD
jgi:membrane-associated protein